MSTCSRVVKGCVALSAAFSCATLADTSTEQAANTGIRHTSAIAAYYSRGDYGMDADTRIRFLPLSHEFASGHWRLKVTAPLLEISGSANVLVNVGSVGFVSDERVSSSGPGDIMVNVTYEVPPISERLPFFDISMEIKMPVASETRGLGTGQVDGGLQVDAYQSWGSATLFATVGWKYRQSSPVFAGLRNGWIYSAGFSAPLNEGWQAGLIMDYRQPVSAFAGATRELLPYVSWTVSARWSLMFYAVKGFTQDSANLGAGSQLSYRW